MSAIVVVEFPMTEQGAQDFIDWRKSDDGYVITSQHKGFEDIRTFLAEDKKQFTSIKNGIAKKIIKLI